MSDRSDLSVPDDDEDDPQLDQEFPDDEDDDLDIPAFLRRQANWLLSKYRL